MDFSSNRKENSGILIGYFSFLWDKKWRLKVVGFVSLSFKKRIKIVKTMNLFPINNLKAAIYVRVSTALQAKHGMGIEGQINVCKRMCKIKNYTVHDVYKDEAISGTTSHNDRKELTRLIEDAAENKFNVVVFYKLDRIGRNIRVILNTIDELIKLNLKIVSCEENIDTTTDEGSFMLHIYASVSDLELRTIKRRLHSGLKEKRKKDGGIGGPLPYGYSRIDKKIAINLHQAEVIKYIYDSYYNKKITPGKIAQLLSNSNIKTVTGKDIWHRNTIRNILKNQDKYNGTELIYHNENDIYWPKILINFSLG